MNQRIETAQKRYEASRKQREACFSRLEPKAQRHRELGNQINALQKALEDLTAIPLGEVLEKAKLLAEARRERWLITGDVEAMSKAYDEALADEQATLAELVSLHQSILEGRVV